jgi:hypothetical protein
VPTKTQATRGISRIDQETTRTHGFFARVGYERSKDGRWRPKATRYFGDASHNGKKGALKAAEAWVKKMGREAKAGSNGKRATAKKAARKRA